MVLVYSVYVWLYVTVKNLNPFPTLDIRNSYLPYFTFAEKIASDNESIVESSEYSSQYITEKTTSDGESMTKSSEYSPQNVTEKTTSDIKRITESSEYSPQNITEKTTSDSKRTTKSSEYSPQSISEKITSDSKRTAGSSEYSPQNITEKITNDSKRTTESSEYSPQNITEKTTGDNKRTTESSEYSPHNSTEKTTSDSKRTTESSEYSPQNITEKTTSDSKSMSESPEYNSANILVKTASDIKSISESKYNPPTITEKTANGIKSMTESSEYYQSNITETTASDMESNTESPEFNPSNITEKAISDSKTVTESSEYDQPNILEKMDTDSKSMAEQEHDPSDNDPGILKPIEQLSVYDQDDLQPSGNDQDMKTILWYDNIHQSMLGHSKMINFSSCAFKNCKFKYLISRSHIKPKKPFDADAVIIQGRAIQALSPPPRRDHNQVFILAVRDSYPALRTGTIGKIGHLWAKAFNWTMTFRLDSDIVYKYANIIERDGNNRRNLSDHHYNEIFDRKKKNALWIVSHCKTLSHREDYVKVLRNTLPVDIFGGCGKSICKKGTFCFGEMEKTYKFYLAFENTMYTDYVTEKVFNWYNRNIIIVVRGGAKYSRIIPKGTVIDASEFKSATSLGKYLKKVAADKELYLSYLRKKDKYLNTGKMTEVQNAYCNLCERLNKLDEHRHSYSNIINWWKK